MNCKHCGKPIVLVPSSAERAKKDVTGKSAKYYEALFPYHAECELELRRVVHNELIEQRNASEETKIDKIRLA